jgi:hypothetical protein
MKRSSEICRKQTMIQEEAHDHKDSLVVRSEEEPWKEDDGDEEEGAVSLPSDSSSVIHEKGQCQTASYSLVSVLLRMSSQDSELIFWHAVTDAVGAY